MALWVRKLLVIVAAALSVSMPGSAHAVTGGSGDTSHAYAVAIVSGGKVTCSGVWTTVRSGHRVVVTDAHCVSSVRGASARVYFGTQWTSGARTYAGRSFRDPRYNANTHRDDLAVIVLSAPPALSAASLGASGSAARQSAVTTVGFGAPHRGQRRTAREAVQSASSWRLYLRPGSGNSCDGDSGGPDLIEGSSTLVAVTDMGSCSYDEDTRVDSGTARSFLVDAP